MWRKLIDKLQVWLYLGGNTELALLVGRWGTLATPIPQLAPMPPALMSYTTEDDTPTEKLTIFEFDPTFSRNEERGIDVANDIAVPASRLDIN